MTLPKEGRDALIREMLAMLFPGQPYWGGLTRGAQTKVKNALLLIALVSLVARADRPVRVLEIGSWTGFTALTWASAVSRLSPAAGEVVCIDLWEPYLADSDIESSALVYRDMDRMLRSGLAYELFRHNSACGPSNVPINHMKGRSADILPTLKPGSFDIVYIDGSHYYSDVKADIIAARPLVADGGILAGDDLEMQLGEIDENTVRKHLGSDFVTRDGRGFHPGVTLAVAEIFGRVSSLHKTWYLRREGSQFAHADPLQGRVIVPPEWPPEMQDEAQRLLVPEPPDGRR